MDVVFATIFHRRDFSSAVALDDHCMGPRVSVEKHGRTWLGLALFPYCLPSTCTRLHYQTSYHKNRFHDDATQLQTM